MHKEPEVIPLVQPHLEHGRHTWFASEHDLDPLCVPYQFRDHFTFPSERKLLRIVVVAQRDDVRVGLVAVAPSHHSALLRKPFCATGAFVLFNASTICIPTSNFLRSSGNCFSAARSASASSSSCWCRCSR